MAYFSTLIAIASMQLDFSEVYQIFSSLLGFRTGGMIELH